MRTKHLNPLLHFAYKPRVETLRYKMSRPIRDIGVEYNCGCDMPTCSAVGTIHFVARDFNPWNVCTDWCRIYHQFFTTFTASSSLPDCNCS